MKNNNKIMEDSNRSEDNQDTIEVFEEYADPEIARPFDPTKINITVKSLIIDSLIKRMKSVPPRIDLNTEFQRMSGLWDKTAQSRLIESLMIRIPIPAFYFDGTNDDSWKVVDGLQRLATLKHFIIDEELILQNLEFLKKYNGQKFSDLPAYLQARIEETTITAHIINPGTPDDVKFNIFKRINTGGISLTPQEIRHALNQGVPANFIKELAELPEFTKATHGILTDRKRMEDRDFVNRFIAFYFGYDNYTSDLDDYLNKAMADLKKNSKEELEKIKNDFKRAMDTSYILFGEWAFRKRFKESDRKYPINKSLFDTWSVNLALLSDENHKKLISKKNIVINKFITLMNNDEDFLAAITTGTGKMAGVRKRFAAIKELLQECLNDNQNQA